MALFLIDISFIEKGATIILRRFYGWLFFGFFIFLKLSMYVVGSGGVSYFFILVLLVWIKNAISINFDLSLNQQQGILNSEWFGNYVFKGFRF